MTEYWVSKDNYWCKMCKCWIKDNKSSRLIHEQGQRHAANLKEHLKGVWSKGREQRDEKKELQDELRAIEEAALKEFEIDLRKKGVDNYRENAQRALSSNTMVEGGHRFARKQPTEAEVAAAAADEGPQEVPEWKRAANAAAAALRVQFYYVDSAGTQQGPHPLAHMQTWYKGGQLPAGTMVAVAGGTKWMQVGRCAAIAAPESEAGAAELSEAGQMLSQQEEKEEQEAFIEKKKKALEESGDDGSSTKASSLGTSANRTPLGDDGEAENSEHSAGCKCPLCKIKIEPKTGTLQTEEEREVQEKKDAWAAKKAAGGDDDDDEPKKKKKKADRDDNGYGKWETVTVATTYTTGAQNARMTGHGYKIKGEDPDDSSGDDDDEPRLEFRSDKPVVAFAKRKVKQKGKRNMRKKGSEEVQVGEQRS